MKNTLQESYILLIKTDQYVGEFERDLCAYATGCIGDCGVGRKEAKIFQDENPDVDLSNLIGKEMDDYGCSRPVGVDTYNDLMIFFRNLPEPELRQLISDRVYKFPAYSATHKFGQENLSILGIEWVKKEVMTIYKELEN